MRYTSVEPGLALAGENPLASKHHLADPSLAVAALGATPESLMGDLKTMGFLLNRL